MKSKKILLYVAYSIGMFLAALSFAMMILMLFDPDVQVSLKKFLVYGAALGFGWVILLLEAMFKPFKRRFILIITLIALLFTIFTSIIVHRQEPFQMWYYWFSMIIPSVVAFFYLFVFFYSKPSAEESAEQVTEPEPPVETGTAGGTAEGKEQ
ncbi:MAG: hypothetical protein JXR52_04410 [Bacteroidales bacterium]|nr:hypothetical protein [Bacteroidales bacterium]